MKRIINLLLTFAVLWVATTYFSESVSVNSTKDLIITVLLMFGINCLYGLVSFVVILLGAFLSGLSNNSFAVVLSFVLVAISAFCWSFIELIIVDSIFTWFFN